MKFHTRTIRDFKNTALFLAYFVFDFWIEINVAHYSYQLYKTAYF